jgi:hypothetical protein
MGRREIIIRYIVDVPDTTTYGDIKTGVQEALSHLHHKPISDVLVNLVTPGTVLTYPNDEPRFRAIIKKTEFTQK